MQFGISGRSPTNLTQLKASITELLELLCDKISTLCQEKKQNRKIKKKQPPAKPNKHTKLEWPPNKFVLWLNF